MDADQPGQAHRQLQASLTRQLQSVCSWAGQLAGQLDQHRAAGQVQLQCALAGLHQAAAAHHRRRQEPLLAVCTACLWLVAELVQV